ncbi:MAG: hypothetical protein HKP12_00080 [Gammaproteobacteria bacterium]|nr:hypothetical protein [Gammaproteobacteria bacterium]
MAVTKKQPVARNTVIANSINTAVYNLEITLEKANKAIAARSAESKKLMNESRRLRKRHVAQMNRKKRAIAAEKKNSTAETRKAVKVAIAELNATKQSIEKTTAARQAVLEELNGLKQSQKTVNAYVKGINTADRLIARSNKKKRT